MHAIRLAHNRVCISKCRRKKFLALNKVRSTKRPTQKQMKGRQRFIHKCMTCNRGCCATRRIVNVSQQESAQGALGLATAHRGPHSSSQLWWSLSSESGSHQRKFVCVLVEAGRVWLLRACAERGSAVEKSYGTPGLAGLFPDLSHTKPRITAIELSPSVRFPRRHW